MPHHRAVLADTTAAINNTRVTLALPPLSFSPPSPVNDTLNRSLLNQSMIVNGSKSSRAKWDTSAAHKQNVRQSMFHAPINVSAESDGNNGSGGCANTSAELSLLDITNNANNAPSPRHAVATEPQSTAKKLKASVKHSAAKARVAAARTRSQTNAALNTSTTGNAALDQAEKILMTVGSKRGPPSTKLNDSTSHNNNTTGTSAHKRLKSVDKPRATVSGNENYMPPPAPLAATRSKPNLSKTRQSLSKTMVHVTTRQSMALAMPSPRVSQPQQSPSPTLRQSALFAPASPAQPSRPSSALARSSPRQSMGLVSPSSSSLKKSHMSEHSMTQISKLTEEKNNLTVLNAGLSRDIINERQRASQLTNENHSLTVTLKKLTAERSSLLDSITDKDSLRAQLQSKILSLESQLLSQQSLHEAQLAEWQQRCYTGDEARKKLHSYLQSLKGPIRVLARLRPRLHCESNSDIILTHSLVNNETRMLEMTGSKPHTFVFDRVFGMECTQREVYEDVSEIVTSCLDGQSVLIVAYGMTGSGKTWTMDGPTVHSEDVNSVDFSVTSASTSTSRPHHRHASTSFISSTHNHYEDRGVIQRSLEQIFHDIDSRAVNGWQYHCELTIFEVYNDIIRDLLNTSTNTKVTHEVRANGQITHLTMKRISTVEDAYPLLDLAKRLRRVSATDCNDRSSRSHLIVQLHLRATNTRTGQSLDSALNLIDLAGSERVKLSRVDGVKLKEAQEINKSLSSLANVFTAINSNDSHIPFRNSKLTHLLQPALSNDSKTIFIINLSPIEEHCNESMASLRFAQSVSAAHVGKRR